MDGVMTRDIWTHTRQSAVEIAKILLPLVKPHHISPGSMQLQFFHDSYPMGYRQQLNAIKKAPDKGAFSYPSNAK